MYSRKPQDTVHYAQPLGSYSLWEEWIPYGSSCSLPRSAVLFQFLKVKIHVSNRWLNKVQFYTCEFSISIHVQCTYNHAKHVQRVQLMIQYLLWHPEFETKNYNLDNISACLIPATKLNLNLPIYGGSKTANLVNVFSLESFLLYGIIQCTVAF